MAIILVGVNFFLGNNVNKTAGIVIGGLGVLTEIVAVVMFFLPTKKSLDK